jgi:DNA-binding response OmpR family regulator
VGAEFFLVAVPGPIRRPDTVLTPDAPEAMNTPERLTVLCIDDDPLVLHFYREFLDRHGYRVVTVEDGLLGIDLAHRERPDVILLDIMLRGLSGFDICRKLRADPAFRYVPIILITVWDHPSVGVTGQRAGATLTLHKPADPETLVTALAQVLGQATDRHEAYGEASA